MRQLMAASLAVMMGVAACGPRQVEVRTAPTQESQIILAVNNTLNQAVNVYATVGTTDTFLRQVGPKQSVTIPVQGFASGTSVTLKAVTVDGVHTYSRQNVTLSGTYNFPIP